MSVEDLIKQRQQEMPEHSKKMGASYEKSLDKKNQVFHRVRSRISDKREIFLNRHAGEQQFVRNQVWKLIEDEIDSNRTEWVLSSYERAEVLEQIMQTMFGYGVIEPFIHDPNVTEIMVNGIGKIFIERHGEIELAKDRRNNPLQFKSEEELRHVIEKIVSPLNRKINDSDPIVDARLPNGSRVNVVLSPIALDGASLTIRKFPERPYTMKELVSFGLCKFDVAEMLGKWVRDRANILISGGTGSGKTTLLNALSMYIPENSRLVTIEDAAELMLTHANNIIRLETRPPNIEGSGEITIRDLVRNSLRMRPDRIIVGEVRGGEALDMLQAMNTGHEGSLTTGHANSARDMLGRLETMVLMAGLELPVSAIRQQIASALDYIIHVSKTKSGKRRITEIAKVNGMLDKEVEITTLYRWNEQIDELEALHSNI